MVVGISDWNDLDNVRNDLTGDYVLVNDLDSDTNGYAGIGDDWNPIGEQAFDGNFYEGVFDGDGFEIRDLIVDTTDRNVGLFSGIRSPGEIKNLSVVGDITTTSDSYNAGVLCSENRGLIENCTAGGSVTALSISVSGGLVGQNEDTVTDSYATGSVEGGDEYVGGLVGRNADTVTDSYATGSVEGNEQVGGLVGENRDTVTESYATGSVEGGSEVGGFIGSQSGDTVTDCYSTGFVSGNTQVNGFLGREDPFEPNYTNTYYDTETSGQDDTNEATPLTTAEMQGSEAETNMGGFDFEGAWSLVVENENSDGDGYPILREIDFETQGDEQNLTITGYFPELFALTVETNPATDISEFSATLNGELVELDDEADDADVFFEFGENVTDSQTAIQTLTKPETFDELVDELEPNTTFEFRAVAEAQDADNETETDEGDILTFDTEIVTLDGTISLDEAGVENADVLANNLTQATFGGQTTTDIDGNYTVDLPDVDRLDTIAVAVDFDDGTDRYGRLVTTVIE